MHKAALTAAIALGLMVPGVASAAPATFAGSCDFSGTSTLPNGFGQALGKVTLNATQGQCSGRLVRADGVVLTGARSATFTGSATEPWASCHASAGGGPDLTGGSKATIRFVDVYPAPPGVDPGDELIRAIVSASAHVRGDAVRWLLQGATNATYPAGTFAGLDVTWPACPGAAMNARLTTGTSPSPSGAPSDVLIDAG